MSCNPPAQRQPFTRRKQDLYVYALVQLYVRVRVYTTATEADIVNTSLMRARQALPFSFEENSFSHVASALAGHCWTFRWEEMLE